MKKYIIFIIIINLSIGCTSKKIVTEYKDRTVRDTIYTTKTTKEVQRFTDTLTIDSPCDSVTGKLKPFKQAIKIKQGSILIEGKNDSITAKIDLKGYKDVLERTYQAKYDKFVQENNKEVVKYKVAWYHWLIHIICALVIIILLRIRLF